MEIQEIEVTIAKNGQVKIHVRGARGKKCLDLTRDLEASLGGAILDRTLTAEAQDNKAGNEIDQKVEVKGK